MPDEKTIEDRFWEKVNRDGPLHPYDPDLGPCFLWVASKSNKGYGTISKDGGPKYAHRIAWEIANGPIPDGVQVLHSCDNTLCVNERHLFLGTRFDNMQDMATKGRHHNLHKTHCPQGHEYTPENTLPWKGRRICRTCHRIYGRESERKRREKNRAR